MSRVYFKFLSTTCFASSSYIAMGGTVLGNEVFGYCNMNTAKSDFMKNGESSSRISSD